MKLTAELRPEGTFITLQELRSFVQYVDSLNTFADDSHVHVMPKHVEVVHNTQQRTLPKPEHVAKQHDDATQQLKASADTATQDKGDDDGTAQYGALRPYAR